MELGEFGIKRQKEEREKVSTRFVYTHTHTHTQYSTVYSRSWLFALRSWLFLLLSRDDRPHKDPPHIFAEFSGRRFTDSADLRFRRGVKIDPPKCVCVCVCV